MSIVKEMFQKLFVPLMLKWKIIRLLNIKNLKRTSAGAIPIRLKLYSHSYVYTFYGHLDFVSPDGVYFKNVRIRVERADRTVGRLRYKGINILYVCRKFNIYKVSVAGNNNKEAGAFIVMLIDNWYRVSRTDIVSRFQDYIKKSKEISVTGLEGD